MPRKTGNQSIKLELHLGESVPLPRRKPSPLIQSSLITVDALLNPHYLSYTLVVVAGFYPN